MGGWPARMDGFGWGARRPMQRVAASGFRACLAISGDQTRLADLHLQGCRYGIHWDTPNPVLFGDMLFERVIIDKSTLAGLAVGPDSIIGESHFISSIVGGAPFGIYKETGGQTDTVLHGTEFQSMQFENIGNALLSDDRTASSRRAMAYNTVFRQTQFLWNPAFALPGVPAAAIFDLRQMYIVTIDGLREPGSWSPGTLSVLNLAVPAGVELHGDVDTVLGLAATAGRPFATIGGGGTQAFRVAQTGGWSGRVVSVHDGAPIRAGDLVAAEGAEFRRRTWRSRRGDLGRCHDRCSGPRRECQFCARHARGGDGTGDRRGRRRRAAGCGAGRDAGGRHCGEGWHPAAVRGRSTEGLVAGTGLNTVRGSGLKVPLISASQRK